MGVDLAEQINQQMRFALPKVDDTGSIARTLVVLFAPGASNAKARFKDFLVSRFYDDNAVRYADISEGSQVVSELIMRSENIVRFRYTPIVILYVAAMGEDFQLLDCHKQYPAQVIRLYQRESDINENELNTLFVRDNNDGIASLVYLAYIQTSFIHVPAPTGGGVLESWTARLAFDEWIRRLYCQLSADLRDISSDEELLRKQIAEHVEQCCKTFIKKLKKPPAFSQYPIDANGFEEIKAELPNFLQRTFGKGVRLQLKKVLSKLYGKSEDGQPQALYFHKHFFEEQNASALFKRFWQSPEAWYYKIPITQLDNFLVLVLNEHNMVAQEKYRVRLAELRESRLSDHISIDGQKKQDIIAALTPWEKSTNKLYRVYAEAWFWETALADAREGRLYRSMTGAKKRIEDQRQYLLDCNAQTTARSDEPYLASWGQDISESARQRRPLDADWTSENLDQAINAGCTLSCLKHVGYTPKLYGFLRCENKQERAKIKAIAFSGGAVTAEWNFISDTALRGIAAVVSVAPTAFYTEKNGGQACD